MRSPPQSKYARIERERRFLVQQFPAGVAPVRTRRLVDRYIAGTSLRLREELEEGSAPVYKLTQKIALTAEQGWITTIYLTDAEYSLFTQLPAGVLRKTRYSVPPFGIDVFEGTLQGLVMAEAEFGSDAEAAALPIPPFLFREVTSDPRFTGGSLACASPSELAAWLAECRGT